MTAVSGTTGGMDGTRVPVNVKTARRRMVVYQSLADLINDLEKVEAAHRAGSLRRLGNREPGAILGHLAVSVRNSIDGADELRKVVPWWLRVAGPLVKKRVLNAPIRPGVKLPAGADTALWNDAVSVEAGLSDLRSQIARLSKGETPRAAHPVFGKMSEEDWGKFHLRHSEMHMSFLQV